MCSAPPSMGAEPPPEAVEAGLVEAGAGKEGEADDGLWPEFADEVPETYYLLCDTSAKVRAPSCGRSGQASHCPGSL